MSGAWSVGVRAKLPRDLWIVLLVALGLRLVFAFVVYGYPPDIACFQGWAKHVATVGFSRFYSGEMYADYPPGYIYVLFVLGHLKNLFGLPDGSPPSLVLLKLPAILADLAIALLLFRLARVHLGEETAIFLSAFFALNPAVGLDSALWGQVDSVFVLPLFVGMLLLLKKRFELSAFFFALALLVKPQTLVFAPLWLFAFLEWKSTATFIRSLLVGVGTLVGLSLPFSLPRVLAIYRGAVGSYQYATLNAFNFFALFGGNWVPDTHKFLFLSFREWGYIAIVAIVVASALLFFRRRDEERFPIVALFLAFSVFLFVHRMHERYLFPALVFALWWYTYRPDCRVLTLFAGLSATFFVNVGLVLLFSFYRKYHLPPFDWRLLGTSGVNLALWGFFLFLVLRERPPEQKRMPTAKQPGALVTEKGGVSMGRKQSLIAVLVLSALSFSLSLYHLGSRRAPQTYWEPREKGETVLVDLGKVCEVGRISYFPGLVQGGSYTIEYSRDGIVWEKTCELKPDWVFRWEYLDGFFPGRFFKIIVEEPRGMLGEVAFFEAGNPSPLPIISVTPLSPSSGFERLFDEQPYAQYERSYFTGTYFDEIYHARTAFEHLHRLPPYEWTHPPLGKIIIALGIALLGMNPLGWRIMGVIFGTLLVPTVFLLARLFVRDEYALFAAALFAFDFMRFVQARIATIDTYVVFFTLVAFYFLFRYFLHGTEDRKGLRLLFLSGLFFGLGAATKWTAIYAGGGMALLFLVHHVLQAKKSPAHWKHLFRRVLPWALLFFIAVPACVYCFSYLPYLLVPGYSLRDVFRYQLSMYRYHHDLKATHPFSSPWWEWPVIARPIWLYKGEGLPKGYISSIVSLGNPALWWVGCITVLFALVTPVFWKERGVLWILVAFFSQYVPWMLVPRITFIYHYYGCVPFMAVLLGIFFAWLEREKPSLRVWRWVLLGVTVGLFVLFYPILSGEVVSKAYVARFLRWFPSWTFFSGGE